MIEPLAEAEAAAVEPLGRAAGRDLRRRQQVKGGSGRAARRGMVAAVGPLAKKPAAAANG